MDSDNPTTTSTSTSQSIPATTASTRKNLAFVIDITGSMSSWIKALSEILPSLIQSIALTRAFDSIAIMGYADYDSQEVITFSGFCTYENIAELQQFASKLTTRGGGSCEASKTGLFKLTEHKEKIPGKLWILHLCDQPPHTLGRLDNEGKKEQAKLGEYFDFVPLTNFLMQTFPQVSYYCLTTAPHQCYCYLAQKTQGYVFVLAGELSAGNIRNYIGRVFNGWFGSENPISEHREINMSGYANETEISALAVRVNKINPNSEKMLVSSLLTSVALMKNDPVFLEHVISEFRTIISNNPMALTCTPVLGKMWRELCKRRSDVRRDELIELLSRKKHSLNSEDRPVLEKWLTESYNSQAEIDEEIKKFMAKNDTVGLLRFLPEDNSLCSQQIVQLLAAGDRKSTATIRAILSRMYIDTQFKHSKIELDEDTNIPLPEASIPLNVYPNVLFELAMHTVAPGTKLTRRYAAMLAMHAIQCGSVLQSRAETFLDKIKGHWINWKRREDQSPEIPDNFSNSFLDLILHPACINMLTDEEITQAKYFKKISYLMRFFTQTEVTVKIIDSSSIDGIFPEHQFHCKDCDADRPLSLISEKGICGHCETSPRPKDTKYVSVRCYPCGSLYSRDRTAYVMGYSKCHNCRAGVGPSPCVTCSTCKLKYVQFHKTSEGLPNGVCATCVSGTPINRSLQFETYPAFAHQVLKDCFPTLCAALGFKVESSFKPHCGIYDAVLHLTQVEPEVTQPPEKVYFRETLVVQNKDEIWKYMLNVMAGGKQELPECAICLENFHPSEIIPACGRKGCAQRVCNQCSRNWYSKNSPGNLLYNRSLLCQFCSRVPGPQILGRVANNLIALAAQISKFPLNQDMYYAWCRQCLRPKEIANRSCTTETINIQNYSCSECITGTSISVITKECPKCTVTISKISGCNHIHCTSCGSHWCWQCETLCKSSGEVYDHMHSVHGRIFDEEVADYIAEDDE